MMAGWLFLMLVSGRPRGFRELLRDPITWIYGVLRVATDIVADPHTLAN